jgi:hypothetical protein
MTQQPLLTADEVIELLQKEVLANNAALLGNFMELADEEKLVLGKFNDPNKEIPLLQQCANFLRNKGVFVYFNIEKSCGRPYYFEFVAGECGRVLEKIEWQAYYLADLSCFIDMHEHELPPTIVAEKERIDTYKDRLIEVIFWGLQRAYKKGDKVALEFWCDEGRKLTEEVEAYLDSIIDLRRLHAISLIL